MSQEAFATWAIVEVMGHKRFAGFVSEQVVAGHGFVRVDVPPIGEGPRDGAFTKLFGTASIYAITPVAEDVARKAAASFRERPVETWLLEQPKLIGAGSDEEVEDLDDEQEARDYSTFPDPR
jgi:hypothetical protein